ncbi:hypothetical protein BJ546DRAFT_992315, partial [Cryomyces antarcticus]
VGDHWRIPNVVCFASLLRLLTSVLSKKLLLRCHCAHEISVFVLPEYPFSSWFCVLRPRTECGCSRDRAQLATTLQTKGHSRENPLSPLSESNGRSSCNGCCNHAGFNAGYRLKHRDRTTT